MKLKLAVLGLTVLGSIALATGQASAAMPNGIPQAGQIAGAAADVDQVAWVCGRWGRCWWRPSYYGAYGYYAPRRYYGPRPWGWHHHHHWRRW